MQKTFLVFILLLQLIESLGLVWHEGCYSLIKAMMLKSILTYKESIMKTIALFSLFSALILGSFSLAQAQSVEAKQTAAEISRCDGGGYNGGSGHNNGGHYGGGHRGGHY